MGFNPYRKHPERKNQPIAYFISVVLHVVLAVWLGKMAVEYVVPAGDVTSLEMEYQMPQGAQTETTEIDVIDSAEAPAMSKTEPPPPPAAPKPKPEPKPAAKKVKAVKPAPPLEAPQIAKPEASSAEGDMVVEKEPEPEKSSEVEPPPEVPQVEEPPEITQDKPQETLPPDDTAEEPVNAAESDELPDKTNEEALDKADPSETVIPPTDQLTESDSQLDTPDVKSPPTPSPVTSPTGTGTQATHTDLSDMPTKEAPSGQGIPGPRNLPAKKATSASAFGIPNGVVLPDSVLSPYASNRPPNYPFWARMRGKEGTVVVHYVVNTKGLVEQVRIVKSSGVAVLDQEAAKAVQKWRFKPMPQKGIYERPFRFRLKGAAKEAPTRLRTK